jgi:hypothetical protein
MVIPFQQKEDFSAADVIDPSFSEMMPQQRGA